jgi:hypothetical protein
MDKTDVFMGKTGVQQTRSDREPIRRDPPKISRKMQATPPSPSTFFRQAGTMQWERRYPTCAARGNPCRGKGGPVSHARTHPIVRSILRGTDCRRPRGLEIRAPLPRTHLHRSDYESGAYRMSFEPQMNTDFCR